MVDNIQPSGPTSGPEEAPPVTNPERNPQVAGKQRYASMDSFMKKNPEVYNAMMTSMAIEMCNKWKRAEDRIHKLKKEHERR